MALFLSTFTNKIDKKGRLSVPASFRAALAKEEFQGAVAYPSFVNPCIEACGMERMERIYESIDGMDPYSEERDAFAASILGSSVQLPFDGDGRIVLPDSLMLQANLDDKAVFVGKGKTFEIWEPDAFAAYADKMREIAKNNRGALRFGGAASGNGGADAR
jgi:MraZ protein